MEATGTSDSAPFFSSAAALFFGAAKKHSSRFVAGFCTYEEVYLNFLGRHNGVPRSVVFPNLTSISSGNFL